jgi:hypothetical protein
MSVRRFGALGTPILVLLSLLLLSATGCRTVPLPESEPPPIRVSSEGAPARRAILAGISDAGWSVHKEEGRAIFARLDVRKHMLIVRIAYDDELITMSYHDSRNLLCNKRGDTCDRIHRKYPAWVHRLSQHIIDHLGQES